MNKVMEIRVNVGRIGKLETREWVEVGGMGWGLGVGGREEEDGTECVET